MAHRRPLHPFTLTTLRSFGRAPDGDLPQVEPAVLRTEYRQQARGMLSEMRGPYWRLPGAVARHRTALPPVAIARFFGGRP